MSSVASSGRARVGSSWRAGSLQAPASASASLAQRCAPRAARTPCCSTASPRCRALHGGAPGAAQPARRGSRVASAGEDGGALPSTSGPTVEEALRTLGLEQGKAHSFEQILGAKNAALAKARDQLGQLEVEAAYDVLFMQSMKKRITGELEVSSSVRFADVPTRKRSRSSAPQSLLQKLPGGGLTLEQPKQSVAAGQAAVFAGLGTWAIIGALLESPDAQAADTAGVQLAAALAFAVYGFREYKKLPLGRAVGLSAGALVAGILLGAALNAWLRVDIVPLGAFGSPGVLVSTFGIAGLALASAFLA